MPDFQRFAVSRTGAKVRVEGEIRDSQSNALIHDCTGNNAVEFIFNWQRNGLTQVQEDVLVSQIAQDVLLFSAGLK